MPRLAIDLFALSIQLIGGAAKLKLVVAATREARSSYSWLDRTLHQLASAGRGLQKVLADVEEHVFVDSFEHVIIERPVFISSLPRTGTTLLGTATRAAGIRVSHLSEHLASHATEKTTAFGTKARIDRRKDRSSAFVWE